jgi:hypothetical protein
MISSPARSTPPTVVIRTFLTLAHQSGQYIDRDVDAWGLFAVQSVALGEQGWQPRLTSHIDIASGGAYGSATHRGFNQLYASSNYLGEGAFSASATC